MYKIKTIESPEKISNGNTALIDIYNWGCKYRPETKAILCHIQEQGLLLKMSCKESNPLISVQPRIGMVCVDSCMEFFFDISKNHSVDTPYINIEVNAAGALCCEAGAIGNRIEFTKAGIPLPKVETYIHDDEWGFTLLVSNEILKAVYPDVSLKSGSVIYGSFYKCGDHTEQPHYGSFVKIDTPRPSFHQPAFFAEMIIE